MAKNVNKKGKKALKIVLLSIAAIILIALFYVAYVFISYSRIDDNVVLTPDIVGSPSDEVAVVGDEYTITTYNIGFGAYTSDYSFFMDGGKSSWAKDKDGLIKNINDIGNAILKTDADFVVLQEVDTDGTRTYHVNEYSRLQSILGSNNYIYAENFHSSFLMYPLLEPHGANKSGLVTVTNLAIDNSIRRQLPISTSVTKVVDLDRCYSITRVPTSNGKFLCIYNVHLSAYGADDSVREGQLNTLFEDMKEDYANGNYVICGGDYNHNLRDESAENVPAWAGLFPKETLPEGFTMAYEKCANPNVKLDTCRDADLPYDKDKSFTVMVDGFIVSNNVDVSYYENTDLEFSYSDHNPVVMKFVLE